MVILLKKLLFIFSLFSILSLLACKKNLDASPSQNSNTDKLSVSNPIAEINQGIRFLDTTLAPDDSTAAFICSKYNKYYKWVVTPSGYDSILYDSSASPVIIFNRSGNYTVSGNIYNSLTNELIGSTETVTINVSNDTLQQFQPIAATDTLIIIPTIKANYPTSIQLLFSTSKKYLIYPYTGFYAPVSGDDHNYVFNFVSIMLDTYPFVYATVNNTQVTDSMYLAPVFYSHLSNQTANLTITWLGKTYTGSITETTTGSLLIEWNYTDGVIIKQN